MHARSLIEFIGRRMRQRRGDIVRLLGADSVRRIYRYADALHCEVIDQVADEYISMSGIPMEDYDNVAACRYEVPDYWTICEVFERLVEDVTRGDVLATLHEVYGSWMCNAISN
jgi:hypothetical protein